MNYVEVFIDDLKIDLGSEEVVFPITYELIDIKNLNNRSGSKTKTVKVPRTAKNEKIFGFPYDPNGQNQFSKYEPRGIRVEENGYPVFIGLMQLTDVTRSTISFFCFAELSKFKGISGTKMLSELNLRDLDHIYDETIFDTWNGIYPIYVPDDYFYPLIDYGQFKDRTPNSPVEPLVDDILITDMYPALYLERAIRQICFDNGYTLSTTFFDDPQTSKILLPFVNEQFIHDRNYGITTYGFIGQTFTNYEIVAESQNVIIDNVYSDGQGQYNTVTDEYTASFVQTAEVFVQIEYYMEGGATTDPPSSISIEKFDFLSSTWSPLVTSPLEYFEGFEFMGETHGMGLSMPIANTTLNVSDKIRVIFTNTNSYTLFQGQAYVSINPSQDNILIEVGEPVQMAPNLPPIKQIDLFTWCYKMFNWVIYVDDSQGVIYIETFDTYYGNNDFKDFSNKITLTPEPVLSYQSTEFKRKYDFKYNHDTNDYYLDIYNGKNTVSQDVLFGDGQLYLVPEGEPQLIGIIGFSPTIVERTFTGTPGTFIELPSIQQKEDRGTKNTQTTPRILINGGLVDLTTLSAGDVSSLEVEDVGTVTQVPLCYFQKKQYNDDIDNFTMNLSFQTPVGIGIWMYGNLIDLYYRKTIENLSISAKLVAYFNLNETDINSLDFSVLWYISEFNSFFRLNKIMDYQPGRLKATKVELIKKSVLLYQGNTNDYVEITP